MSTVDPHEDVSPANVDAGELFEDARQALEDRVDGLVLRDGHIITLALAEQARIAEQVAWALDTALQRHAVGRTAAQLFGISQQAGVRADGVATITMVDDAGYTIDSGTLLAWQPTGDRRDDIELATTDAVAVNQGDTTVDVPIQAVEVGTDANDIAAGEPLAVIQAIPAVDSASVSEATSGGVDAESDEDYLARVIAELAVLSEAGVAPDDFAVLARRTAGVTRALVLDLHDPANPGVDSPRDVTLAPVDSDGIAVGQATADQLVADLDELRIVNTELHTIEPTYTTIDVTFEVHRRSGFNADDVRNACEQAVRDLLKPAHWGGGDDDPPRWELRDTVRYLEVASVLAGVEGVDWVVSLTVNGGESDVSLNGDAPLPAPFDSDLASQAAVTASTVSGTVSSP